MEHFTEDQIKSIIEFDCSQLGPFNKSHPDNELNLKNKKENILKSRTVINIADKTVNKFRCSICDYSCNYDIAYQNHMRIHGTMSVFDDLPVPCTLCDFRCKSNTDLLLHEDNHRFKAPYICSDCGYKNLCEKQFNIHTKKLFHKIKCFKCNAKFVNLFAMKAHLADHITLHCPYCKLDIIFNTTDELNKHMVKHEEKNIFSCQICEKKFQHNSHLKFHLLSHKGIGKNSKKKFKPSEIAGTNVLYT